MNRQEHLLTCLAEECTEVGKRVSKALRFGLDEVQRDQPLSNRLRIVEELSDLISVAEILMCEGVLPPFQPTGIDVAAKRAKIERYMAIARAEGVLQEHSNAVIDVLAERVSQVAKGYTAEHDDQHTGGEIISDPTWGATARLKAVVNGSHPAPAHGLVEAAAQTIAEIERLDRKAAREQDVLQGEEVA